VSVATHVLKTGLEHHVESDVHLVVSRKEPLVDRPRRSVVDRSFKGVAAAVDTGEIGRDGETVGGDGVPTGEITALEVVLEDGDRDVVGCRACGGNDRAVETPLRTACEEKSENNPHKHDIANRVRPHRSSSSMTHPIDD